jgi:alkylhydroperoxidase/carboxymuconolactone decarboxylase family protein YurZ
MQEEDQMATEVKAQTALDRVRAKHAPTAEAFSALRKAVMSSGPLPAHMQELIVCGAFVVTGQQKAFMTHAKRALEGGAKPEELRQAVLVTLGANCTLPQVAAGLSWADEAIGE